MSDPTPCLLGSAGEALSERVQFCHMTQRQTQVAVLIGMFGIAGGMFAFAQHRKDKREQKLADEIRSLPQRVKDTVEKRQQANVTYAAFDNIRVGMTTPEVSKTFNRTHEVIEATEKREVWRFKGPDGGYCDVTIEGVYVVAKQQHGLK
jgi:hypothetical protein